MKYTLRVCNKHTNIGNKRNNNRVLVHAICELIWLLEMEGGSDMARASALKFSHNNYCKDIILWLYTIIIWGDRIILWCCGYLGFRYCSRCHWCFWYIYSSINDKYHSTDNVTTDLVHTYKSDINFFCCAHNVFSIHDFAVNEIKHIPGLIIPDPRYVKRICAIFTTINKIRIC